MANTYLIDDEEDTFGQDSQEVALGRSTLPQGAGSIVTGWIYWRKPEGTIIYAQVAATSYQQLLQQGFQPLAQYGSFVLSPKLSAVGARQRWNPRREPYFQILAGGGAKEFMPFQVVELGWHRRPPIIEGLAVQFPQMLGVEPFDRKCTEPGCSRWFSSLAKVQTDRMLDSHVQYGHEHEEGARIGREIGKALKELQVMPQGVPTASNDSLLARVESLLEKQAARISQLETELAQVKAPRPKDPKRVAAGKALAELRKAQLEKE